jgi:hypothetical protein
LEHGSLGKENCQFFATHARANKTCQGKTFKALNLEFFCIGFIVLVDIKASRLPVLAGQGEESFNHAILVYTSCLFAGVILVVLGTLSIFLVLMNAAYKVLQNALTLYPL